MAHVINVVLLFFLPAIIKTNLYMQPLRLQELFYDEEFVISAFQEAIGLDPNLKEVTKYLDRVSHRIKELPFLIDTTKEDKHLEKIMEVLVGNPLHVYSLVNRFVNHLTQARQELANQPKHAILVRAVHAVIRRGEYPTQADLDGIMLAISRVQFTYSLNPVDMAQGKILGVQTHGFLDSSDLLNVAKGRYSGQTSTYLQQYQEYALAYEWAEAALELARMKKSGGPNNQMEEVIINFMMTVKTQHNQFWKPRSHRPGSQPNEMFFIDRINTQSARDLREAESQMLYNQFSPNFESLYKVSNFHSLFLREFNALCRGELVNMKQSRRCYYDNLDDPYFLIGPLKLEVLSESPLVFVYHEILTPSNQASIKMSVSTQLIPATVAAKDKEGGAVSNERIQSNGWLWDLRFPLLYNISKRVEKITKLKVAPTHNELNYFVVSEPWQIGVYGPGGHYMTHVDSGFEELLKFTSYAPNGVWIGDRISTVMFYLSDVVGGATVFPKIGVTAWPRAGSMVYWHNLHTDGKVDEMMVHGSCPTAIGIKWVGNKWIREGAQIWNRPCISEHKNK